MCLSPRSMSLWRQLIFIWYLVFFHSSSSSREESNISLLKVLPFAQWIYEQKNKNVQHNFHLFAKKAPVALLLNLALWPRGLVPGGVCLLHYSFPRERSGWGLWWRGFVFEKSNENTLDGLDRWANILQDICLFTLHYPRNACRGSFLITLFE